VLLLIVLMLGIRRLQKTLRTEPAGESPSS
jgi:hypothetical protein